MQLPRIRVRRLDNLVLGLLFLIALALPPIAYFYYPAPTALGFEKRRPAPMPERFFSHDFPEKFEKHFKDVFGFRTELVAWHNFAKVEWLGMTTNGVVMIGKQGWRYFGKDQAFEQYMGVVPMSKKDLESWRQTLERRRAWLADRGIDYLLVITPTKESIYPEYLPDIMPPRGRTRMDQFADYLHAHSDLPFLDLRGPLLEAKQNMGWPLFYKTDSHWNELGAYVGYREILTALSKHFPQVQPSPLSDFDVEERDYTGDLCGMLGLKDLVRERAPFPVRKAELCAHLVETGIRPEDHRPVAFGGVGTTETGKTSLPHAIVYGDSYCWNLHQLLDEHFRRITYLIWISGMDHRFIKKEKPDLVLQIQVERFLMYPPQQDTLADDELAPPPK